MTIENISPGDQHRAIVEAINKIWSKKFQSRKGLIYSNEIHEEISIQELNSLAALCSRILNMSGGSVGDFDLYKLFQSYFLDLEKRKKINDVIHK